MQTLTLKVTNLTDGRIIANLLDVKYMDDIGALKAVSSGEIEIEITMVDSEKNEIRSMWYGPLAQSILSLEKPMVVKLLEQTPDTYPPRFIWYERMDSESMEQYPIYHVNLLYPSTQDAKHVIGEHFHITDKTMLKLYLYPHEQYFVKLEIIGLDQLLHLNILSDDVFLKN